MCWDWLTERLDVRWECPTAIDRVLRHYDRYINKLCTRTLYEKDGSSCVRVDEVMKSRLQAKLMKALVEKK